MEARFGFVLACRGAAGTAAKFLYVGGGCYALVETRRDRWAPLLLAFPHADLPVRGYAA